MYLGFTTPLFKIARTWKQRRCLLTDEWIRKLWYIYTMEYYSAVKRNKFESVLVRMIELQRVHNNTVKRPEEQ